MRSLVAALVLMTSISVQAQLPQFPEGNWQGTLDTGMGKIRLVFHIVRSPDGKLTGVMDSPDQSAFGLALAEIAENDGTVQMKLVAPLASFAGTSNAERTEIDGFWQQGGAKLPLTLHRTTATEAAPPARPQTPKPPFPYRSEDVTYPSKAAGVQLAGTLTLPQTGGPFPAALLITGSGAQDRDETILGHKPFLVIADYLTRHGIAVLRVDDRGTAKSTGNFAAATTQDFVDDAAGSVAWLRTRKEIDSERIGLIGHSEGATVGPMLAVRDGHIAFIVMLAGIAVPGRDVLKAQRAAIAKASGLSDTAIAANEALVDKFASLTTSSTPPTDAEIQAAVDRGLATVPEAMRKAAEPALKGQARAMASPWMRFFYAFDPAPVLSKLTIPVLAINGSLDTQVVPSQNLPVIAACLEKAGNRDYEILKLPSLNHLMQTVKTGSPQEYAATEETIAPVVLDSVTTWILRHTNQAAR
jgi:pimeloyl-ACP methyl ester carboxylesterase